MFGFTDMTNDIFFPFVLILSLLLKNFLLCVLPLLTSQITLHVKAVSRRHICTHLLQSTRHGFGSFHKEEISQKQQ